MSYTVSRTKLQIRSFRSAGFTLTEVVVSTLIVGLMLVAAMRGLGAAARASRLTNRRGQATLLANDLMSEILQAGYVDPDGAASLGQESGELGGTREAFDDVDDYHEWTASPPQNKLGDALPNLDLDGWRRSVSVAHVDPDDLTTAISDADDRGVKRITVTVAYENEVLASLVAFQTSAWIDMIPEPGNDRTTGSVP
ncbi:MAG: type IV pilus modification PilV family protein [Planctomycetota bacterium]|jgi:prepilin-type N-terminal cleavage/methylation domain-containing protein